MKKFLYILLLILFAVPNLALAATFNPNYIISDNDLVDKNSMSLDRIQAFLEAKSGTLGSYLTLDPWENLKRASQIIYDACQYYTISPKFLLVTLQKEQSLVTDPSPTEDQYDWATGYGVCDSCSKNDPAIQEYKGFFNQVNWAARRNRQYIEEAGQWHFKVGGTYEIDGQQVTMENQATVNLYTYTPHIHGNYNFWLIWNSWFAKNYPDGSLLQVQGEHGVYLIQNGKKRPFLTRTAFISSYDSRKIILVSKNDLDAYEDGLPIKFANYSLLEGPTGRIFLVVDNQIRYIDSPETFRRIGFNPEEIIDVTEQDLAGYQRGENITIESTYPTGALLQSKETGGISFVQNGVRHSIWSREILKSRYPNKSVIVTDQATIEQYLLGDPVKFKDGELVTSPNANGVYVISNGYRRGIASREVFESLGFKWENIIQTTNKALFIHPEGDKIDF